ncbi:hypothetical protein [Arthrobacter sp. Z1-9]
MPPKISDTPTFAQQRLHLTARAGGSSAVVRLDQIRQRLLIQRVQLELFVRPHLRAAVGRVGGVMWLLA